MKIERVSQKTNEAFIKLYRDAFPLKERKPMGLLKWGEKRGCAEQLVFEEGGFGGMAVTLQWADLVLLDYFAVSPMRRNEGLGSRALQALVDKYPASRMILEIEPPDDRAKNAVQRRKRKAFYEKNGFYDAGLPVTTFTFPLDVMSRGEKVTFEEYRALLINVHGRPFCACMRPRQRTRFLDRI